MPHINNLLLSIFIGDIKFAPNATSFLKRYQILSTIYITLFLTGMIVAYDSLAIIVLQRPEAGTFTIFAIPFAALCLFFLRSGRCEIAAILIVPYFHTVNYAAGQISHRPMLALYGLMLAPQLVSFVSSSSKLQNLNGILSFLQLCNHVKSITEVFQVTLTEEQSIEISTFTLSSFTSLLPLFVCCQIQKSIENNLWHMACESSRKSEQLTREVVQAAAAKDVFISSLSHEIRNPLNSLNGSINFLIGSVKDAKCLEILRNAKVSGEVLLNLVNNVLDAAKLKSDKMEVFNTETDLGEVIKKTFIINLEMMKNSEITAKVYFSSQVPRILWVDSARMLQIMMNLISNALKFTPKKGKIHVRVAWSGLDDTRENLLAPIRDAELEEARKQKARQDQNDNTRPLNCLQSLTSEIVFQELSPSEVNKRVNYFGSSKILKFKPLQTMNNPSYPQNLEEDVWSIYRIETQAHSTPASQTEGSNRRQETNQSGYLKVQVSDTGCGINSANICNLFKMFGQAHAGVASVYGGTGLGLWICRQLCLKMGGDIVAYSAPNQGTTFVFYIRVADNHLNDPEHERYHHVQECVRVMIADDYAYNRDLHKLLLEQEGVQVTTVTNGREAFEIYKCKDENYFAFILMDVQMPEMDGFTAAKAIRGWENEKQRSKTDIYFVSGEYFNEEDVMCGFREGDRKSDVTGIRCLKKPIDIEAIQKVVEKYKKKD